MLDDRLGDLRPAVDAHLLKQRRFKIEYFTIDVLEEGWEGGRLDDALLFVVWSSQSSDIRYVILAIATESFRYLKCNEIQENV